MLRLKDNDTIGIVGAGPAGSLFAINALRLAKEKGWKLNVHLFDRKFFADVGPRGCNMCAGAIGSGFVESLLRMGLPISPKVIRQEISGYNIHIRDSSAYILRGPREKIFTVFRGGGPPTLNTDEVYQSFDQFLLDQATERGAIFHNAMATEIRNSQDRKPVEIYLEEKGKHSHIEADLLVGAFGVNSRLSEKFRFGYVPPKTWHTCQAEIELGQEFIQNKFKGMIHIFSRGSSKIKYTALTPKGRYVTVSAIGENVKIKDLEEEIRASEIKNYLPERWEIRCHCHPHIPVMIARKPFGDRFVIIGDACGSRYLKNGIESALFSATQAAETVFKGGIARESFKAFYYPPCKKRFGWDNRFGKLLFKIHDFFSSHPILSRAALAEVVKEQKEPKVYGTKLSSIYWHMFTGDMPYERIFWGALSPVLQARLVAQVIKTYRTYRSNMSDKSY